MDDVIQEQDVGGKMHQFMPLNEKQLYYELGKTIL